MTELDGVTAFLITLALAALYYPFFMNVVTDFKNSWIYVLVYLFCFVLAFITVIIIRRNENVPNVASDKD